MFYHFEEYQQSILVVWVTETSSSANLGSLTVVSSNQSSLKVDLHWTIWAFRSLLTLGGNVFLRFFSHLAGALLRRSSGDSHADRRRASLGAGSPASVAYPLHSRADAGSFDPYHAAILFRDSRGVSPFPFIFSYGPFQKRCVCSEKQGSTVRSRGRNWVVSNWDRTLSCWKWKRFFWFGNLNQFSVFSFVLQLIKSWCELVFTDDPSDNIFPFFMAHSCIWVSPMYISKITQQVVHNMG